MLGLNILQRHYVISDRVSVLGVEQPPRDHAGLCGLRNDLAVAADHSVDLDRWQQEFGELVTRIGSRFARVEPRRRVAAFFQGMLAGLPRGELLEHRRAGRRARPAQHVLVIDLCRHCDYAEGRPYRGAVVTDLATVHAPFRMLAGENIGSRIVVPTVAGCVER